jgi:hypothetical protein
MLIIPFAGTFAFFHITQTNQKKSKEPASQRTGTVQT